MGKAAYMEEAIQRFFRDKADLSPDMPKLGGGGKGRVVDTVADTRRKLAAFLNAPGPKHIAFTANTCQEVMERCLETFGVDRFMFGSDLPIFRMKAKRIT